MEQNMFERRTVTRFSAAALFDQELETLKKKCKVQK